MSGGVRCSFCSGERGGRFLIHSGDGAAFVAVCDRCVDWMGELVAEARKRAEAELARFQAELRGEAKP